MVLHFYFTVIEFTVVVDPPLCILEFWFSLPFWDFCSEVFRLGCPFCPKSCRPSPCFPTHTSRSVGTRHGRHLPGSTPRTEDFRPGQTLGTETSCPGPYNHTNSSRPGPTISTGTSCLGTTRRSGVWVDDTTLECLLQSFPSLEKVSGTFKILCLLRNRLTLKPPSPSSVGEMFHRPLSSHTLPP